MNEIALNRWWEELCDVDFSFAQFVVFMIGRVARIVTTLPHLL